MKPLARAYANHGRWLADCPRPFCSNAEQLSGAQGLPLFHCTACGAEAPIEWPPDAAELTAVLAARGNKAWMNWYPAGHPIAGRFSLPSGQTVADLHAEDLEHAPELAAWRSFDPLHSGEGSGPNGLDSANDSGGGIGLYRGSIQQ